MYRNKVRFVLFDDALNLLIVTMELI